MNGENRPSNTGINIDSNLDAALDAHLADVRQAILKRAKEIAAREGASGGVGLLHLSEAVSEYAPAKPFPLEHQKPPRWPTLSRLMESITPIILISTALTIVFGAFGLWALSGRIPGAKGPDAINGQSYLDIAKIFAGAIVGSAGAAAVKETRRK